MSKLLRTFKSVLSAILSILLIIMLVLPYIFTADVQAKTHNPGDEMAAYSSNWHFYCIDDYKIAANGVLEKNDIYTYVLPSTRLNNSERAVLFWATLSMLAGLGNQQDINSVIDRINAQASINGLSSINRLVTQEDLKTVIHKAETRAKYPWIADAVNNAEKYMRLGGIIKLEKDSSIGSKTIPMILRDHDTLFNQLPVDKNNFTIEFDPNGEDRDFIQKVPLKFSFDGSVGSWGTDPIGDWKYQKTETSIIFNNPNSEPPKLLIMFDTDGTEYQVMDGAFSSVDDAYENGLQLWVCTECCGNHKNHPSTMPLESHQRLVFLELEAVSKSYYAVINGDLVPSINGNIEFKIYRHIEEMASTYNLQGYKYDQETGKPIEGAVFKLYERFDDKHLIDKERDGAVHIYEGGEPYKSYHKDNPVTWDDFRFVTSAVSDENGHFEKAVNHAYHYDKTFCDGHPSPVFVSVPDEEEDEETGEIVNSGEIEAAQAENQRLANAWAGAVADCEEHASGAFSGVHFHWIMSGVNQLEIENVLSDGGSEGETPDGGITTSAGEDEAYRESGCQADCKATYEKFISLRYSYTWSEHTARDGYTLHGNHPDDIPVEVITTDASEHGANAVFTGMYGKDIHMTFNIVSRSAKSLLEERERISAYQLNIPDPAEPKGEKVHEPPNYLQPLLKFLFPDLQQDKNIPDWESDGEYYVKDEAQDYPATPGNAVKAAEISATVSNATSSNASFNYNFSFLNKKSNQFRYPSNPAQYSYRADRGADEEFSGGNLFAQAYNTALHSASVGKDIEPGPSGNYSHCVNEDREGDAWRIYDHRTEGELHVNKRDLDLQNNEHTDYDSYGDMQGDAVLEGALYSLYAGEDLAHPDGKTGVVYKKDNLVAVGTTDKEGNLSYLAFTVAPGHTYDYNTGQIVRTPDQWADSAPQNLYIADTDYDDYTPDSRYQRRYNNYQTQNGNCWIGRPLLMGNYYVKESARSEGYELSVGNREKSLTNIGQNLDAGGAQDSGGGYAAVTRQVYPEGQISDNATGDYGDPDFNELFFRAESRGTGGGGFDLVLNNLPSGSKVYRLDEGTETKTIEVGTGIYDKVMLGYHVKAEHDYQYPKYNPDGSLETRMVPVNYQANQFTFAEWKDLNSARVQDAVQSAEPGMNEADIIIKLSQDFTLTDLNFTKGKIEKALRVNAKGTPKTTVGGVGYSSIYAGIYDEGVKVGEPDPEGVSGVTPGELAGRTVYGSPVITIELDKLDDYGQPIKVGDVIASVLDFYNTYAFYSYGGVHGIEDSGTRYHITLYASVYGNPSNFFVMGTDEVTDSSVYHRAEYFPDEAGESPRFVYAEYSNNPDNNAFGTYENLKMELLGGRYFASVTLITDVAVTGNGTLITRTIAENVYYKTGQTPRDEHGESIEAFEYAERTTTTNQETVVGKWTQIPILPVNGKPVAHIDSSYTDTFGKSHNDNDLQTYSFRITVPEKMKTLTLADIAVMNGRSGWKVGDRIGGAAYYALVKQASVKAYSDYGKYTESQDGSYVQQAALVYPGQDYVWQDGEHRPGANTRINPIGVQQRVIRQQVKVTKAIDRKSYENTKSYGEVHENWFTEADKMSNFRFKIYLKYNLERLYRDEGGAVVWQNRKGIKIDILEVSRNYPGLVNSVYTKVPHMAEPLYQNSNDAVMRHRSLYSYTDMLLNEHQNPGYTSILETIKVLTEDGTGTRFIPTLNYEKFFNAIQTANNDKWDDAAPTYTSHRPISNEVNRSQYTLENAKASDMVRQFAITWYLKDEIARLVSPVPANAAERENSNGPVPYSDELYDQALYQAIRKAENYLKPFFAYDFDDIYAIEWDGETNGGPDKDKTTLSADAEGKHYYYNLSSYLPYGVYVVAEQQPKYPGLNDFSNRHYQVDKPREVIVPSVYASHAGADMRPEVLNSYYNYDADMRPEELAAKYQIRYNEESQILYAHNHSGDFEIYPNGLHLSNISNGVPANPGAGDYFALTQSEFRPYKNYYNDNDDRSTGEVPYYLSEGQSGREGVSKYYHYSSVSEGFGNANDVPYPDAAVTDDNLYGIRYQDNVRTMQGALTAYDGRYAPMLVPYTVAAPAGESSEAAEAEPEVSGESSYVGYAYNKFVNRYGAYKLRIEKLDGETHENLLHDEAIFNIYAAKRDDDPGGDGAVIFYSRDTMISGTREFLESMGASDIAAIVRKNSWIDRLTGKTYGPGNLFTGTVSRGTPVCEEADQIMLGDAFGNETVAFKSYSTSKDGLMKEESDGSTQSYQNQNVGYLETPQPLGAGAYVIAEVKAPAGHARIKPLALEVYSDQVSYYQNANKDDRVIAAIFEYQSDNPTTNGNKPQDIVHVARVNVENTPIKLTVEKVKESSAGTAETTLDKTVTYKVSGRVDGPLTEIGSNSNLIYAYQKETKEYMGYAWVKGTLEYLAARKAAGEDVELVYQPGGLFAGYGYITRTLETADDTNKYVAGAAMTLFDALELSGSGDTQDQAFKGLVVERNRNNNVTRMYVRAGYAGETVRFIKETDENGHEYEVTYQTGVDSHQDPLFAAGNIWKGEYVKRPDTDILFFDLGKLDIFTTKYVEYDTVTYGYGRDHKPVPLDRLESDKENYDKTDSEYAIYAFKGGVPYLEIVGGDFTKIKYSEHDKTLEVGAGTVIYHLDRDGNRDAHVDPYTGMAYTTETQPDGSAKVIVWAVNVRKDRSGNVIARDKITTSRIATVGENKVGYLDSGAIDITNHSGQNVEKPSYRHTESGYLTGSWKSENGKESHKESTVDKNKLGQNLNESVLTDDNNGQFDKELNPVYDEYGLPDYYQKGQGGYDKGTELYDRNGDFVRYQDSDNLAAYNKAAYRINKDGELHDGDENQESQTQRKLYHRQGEAYILENTWITSDKTPNDPFDFTMTDGQADILKRVPRGVYILEELVNPEGTTKGIPVGITVREIAEMQHAQMIDATTKTEIGKIDGTDNCVINRIDMSSGKVIGTETEGIGNYSYRHVSGASLALYEAQRVYTAEGSFLKKISGTPAVFKSTNSTASTTEIVTGEWTTGSSPAYFEGLPAGEYLLEERRTPSGYVTAKPLEIIVSNTREVQSFLMYDDHTKVEVEKYAVAEGERSFLANVGFTMYSARTDNHGNVIFENGKPQYDDQAVIDTWQTDDATDYTAVINLGIYPNSNQQELTGFTHNFEAMFQQHGTKGRSVGWAVERSAARASAEDTVWIMEDGTRILVTGNLITYPFGMSQEDMDGFLAAYSANSRQDNTIKWVNNRTAVYTAHMQEGEGDHPTAAEMMLRADNGQLIRIYIYSGTESSGNPGYRYEYQFDYRDLPHVNDKACSYLTREGYRRFSYLPAGSSYVLVETSVPDGYVKAPDQVITVGDIPDIQHYAVENEIHSLRISKVSGSGTKELAGVQLGFYKADSDGRFQHQPEFLITRWTTGMDGSYTELDYINGRIPPGYGIGDLKPHTINGLDNGTYYLAEEQSKGYYVLFEPVRVEYSQEDEIRIIRVSNQIAGGELEIIKKDDGGSALLSGAVFEVSAYLSESREAVFVKTINTVDGRAVLKQLPVGKLLSDGSIEPYLYRVKEIRPPDGYAVNTLIETFCFAPDHHGNSYEPGEPARFTVTVFNEKTKICIEKRDFSRLEDSGIDGIFVAGAELAVFEMLGRDEDGGPLYDKENPNAAWVTKAGERHMIEGLKAGKSYILTEQKAPPGYNIMKPILFTVSMDGRKIVAITNGINMITVNTIQVEDYGLNFDNPDVDSIQSLTVHGRYVTGTEMVIVDREGSEAARWPAAGNGYELYPSDVIKDGEIYTIMEFTHFSDGSRMMTGKKTRMLHFEHADSLRINDRIADKTVLALAGPDGTIIHEYHPKESFELETIENNVRPENPRIVLKNRNAEPGDALNPEQAVFGSVFYVNTSHKTADMEVEVMIDSAMSVIETGGGRQEGHRIVWTVPDVKPLHGGYVDFAVEITDKNGLSVAVSATVGAAQISAGSSDKTVKTIPVLQPNKLTVFNELTGSGQLLHAERYDRFTVYLYSDKGEELKGAYVYTGSRSGSLKSGDEILLDGNEFITIDPGSIYKNIRYRIERQEDGQEISSRNTIGTATTKDGAAAIFTREITDTSGREIFVKGESYILTETICYSDGERLQSDRFKFMLSAQGGIDGVGGYDKPAKVLISKEDFTTGRELPGAHIIIRDGNGSIIDEFISGDEPHEITGLEPGGDYILSEVYAPDGYAYSEEIYFTVNQDGTVDTVIMTDKPTRLIFSKQSISSMTELPGGRYQIQKMDGSIVYEYTGDGRPQVVTGLLTAGETYRFVEELAPAGYAYAEAVEFTVSMDGSIDLVVMKDKPTQVIVRKENDDGELLGGAVLQIKDEAGTVIAEFETKAGEIYEINAALIAGQTYVLHEEKAPEGYHLAEDIRFTVSEDGRVDTVIMKDYKITRPVTPTPDEPESEKPRPEKTIGRITAEYLRDSGTVRIELLNPYGPLARAGDDSNVLFWFISAVFFFLALIILKAKRKIKLKAACVCIWIILLFCQVLILHSVIVYGSSSDPTAKPVIEMTEFLRAEDPVIIPDEKLQKDGAEYRLEQWSTVPKQYPERRQKLSGAAILRELEAADEIPLSVPVQVTDELSGMTQEFDFPVIRHRMIEEKWVENFQFPLRYLNYPADSYLLENGKELQGSDLTMLLGTAAELLELLELSQDDYRIRSIKWDGEAYLSDNGEWCRGAIAYGEKRLSTYRLEYRGEAVFEPYEGNLLHAVYRIQEEMEPEKPETTPELQTDAPTSSPDNLIPELEDSSETAVVSAKKLILISIGVSFLIFLLALLIWFATWKKSKNRMEQTEM